MLFFSVADTEMLEYISVKERNAYNFMLKFFGKVISDSGLMRIFDEYKQNCISDPKSAKADIYAKYHRFISANTPSHSKTDVDRIFHKVFNLFVYYSPIPDQ